MSSKRFVISWVALLCLFALGFTIDLKEEPPTLRETIEDIVLENPSHWGWARILESYPKEEA
ncbi:hypothetical protein HON36_00970 [Candidatus Parcubacteria bacterium]|jgi:hypothetical protein|nr:hypothetical protein [Candidatus Parcubacteria bacterium]MBT7228290.1 hypothetical protein [Candidatus Parcubacteria bacterium]